VVIHIDPALLALAGVGLRGAAPLERDGWDDRLDDVFSHGLAGLLSWCHVADLIDLTEPAAHQLRLRLESETVRAVQLEGELIRIQEFLIAAPAVVLKGAVLAHSVYRDPLLRPFTDLDILVAGSNHSRALEALADFGYTRSRPEPAPGYDARVGKALTLTHPGGIIVDLHRTLVAGNLGDSINVVELISQRQTVPIGGVPIPGPSLEGHLIECALHAVIGDGLGRSLSIRDVAQVALHPQLDAARVEDMATRWKVLPQVADGLNAVGEGLHVELPAAVEALSRHRSAGGDPGPAGARSAQSRLDELRHGDLRRRITVTRALIAPSQEFLRWSYGDEPSPVLYGRRWKTLYRRAAESRAGGAEPTAPTDPASTDPRAAETHVDAPEAGAPTAPIAPVTPRDRALEPPGPEIVGPAGRTNRPPPGRPPVVALTPRPPVETVSRTRVAEAAARLATPGVIGPPTRQDQWSATRRPLPQRVPDDAGITGARAGGNDGGNGHGAPVINGNGHANGHANGNGNGNGNGTGGMQPPEPPDVGSDPSAEPPEGAGVERTTVAAAPPKSGVSLFIVGMGLLVITAISAQMGFNNLGIATVPIAGLVFAVSAARRITRVRPDESWVGRWLVIAVLAKVLASYLRYFTLVSSYEGNGDATMYDEIGQKLARAWFNGSHPPDLENWRQTNFLRVFTGWVYYLFGINMVAGFFVFGLLALIGSYLWYRATVDAVPFIDKRLYLALVLFAPSILFWPSSIGKESLMQLGIGAMALGTAWLLRQRLLEGLALGLAGGWLVWVVRPHLVALVSIAVGFAYIAGRVRDRDTGSQKVMGRSVGLIVVALLVAFAVGQGAQFLGITDISNTSSVETALDHQTGRSSQGSSEFESGGDYLSPLNLPRGFVTVLLRPFPWETTSPFQLLASFETAVIAVFLLFRLSSIATAFTRARGTPFLLFCWIMVTLYAATFASFANFGLLVRQRSLVLPALFVLIAVDPVLEKKQRAKRLAVSEPLPPVTRPGGDEPAAIPANGQ
jgi:hypothetical protein